MKVLTIVLCVLDVVLFFIGVYLYFNAQDGLIPILCCVVLFPFASGLMVKCFPYYSDGTS